jgi:hypothetical protein
MRKISTEAAIGLALELLVIILHRFHLREVRITWGIFELGVFLIGDTIARGSWAETIFHPERRRRKRIRVGIAAGIVSVFFGCWVVRLPLEATATAAPPTKVQEATLASPVIAPKPSPRILRKKKPRRKSPGAATKSPLAQKHGAARKPSVEIPSRDFSPIRSSLSILLPLGSHPQKPSRTLLTQYFSLSTAYCARMCLH